MTDRILIDVETVDPKGPVVVSAYDTTGTLIDFETLRFRHPFLLRIRLRLAIRRILLRQKRMAIVRSKLGRILAPWPGKCGH